MPCKKCKDNKYKYGNTGECKYATKEECEKANPKKYNKMKKYPSPIGKKTYEEYAKELKEYNLSSQRIDLKDMKTLAKLAKEADKLDSKFRKLLDKEMDAQFAYEDQQELTKEGKKEYDNSLNNITDVKKQNEKRLEEAAKKSEKSYKIYSASAKKEENLKEKLQKEQQIVLAEKGNIQSFLLDFRSAVSQVESAGKALGVDVPVDKFRNQINKLDALQLRYK
tara:strand:+ start:1517 stop:2185 length:669 start_codon:yes stop_codon:yes gene_type:complete